MRRRFDTMEQFEPARELIEAFRWMVIPLTTTAVFRRWFGSKTNGTILMTIPNDHQERIGVRQISQYGSVPERIRWTG